MTQVARPQRGLLSFLNTDGKAHPRENTLVLLTAVLGIVAFATSFFDGLHLVSSWTGIVGLLTGAIGQFISVTTSERFALIIGMGAAGFGLLLGIAHGGPFGGLLG